MSCADDTSDLDVGFAPRAAWMQQSKATPAMYRLSAHVPKHCTGKRTREPLLNRNDEDSPMQGTSTEHAIRERAYRLWEADGRRDVHYRYVAIELLDGDARLSKAIAASPAAGRKRSTGAKNEPHRESWRPVGLS
ncbi:DUF2934 domain-containing protein [Caballeronia sp. Sq4a]|uniref:DUF2934 domain-containing protein n=1 Tax=Caballeronia sp. Sq4a TaxID=2878152 RepID=UPI00352CE5B1